MSWILAFVVGVILGPFLGIAILCLAFAVMLLWRGRRARTTEGMPAAD